MKNILKIALFVVSISCKAQTIHNINNNEHYGKSGYYYKDVDNLLNKYVGTWLYTNGTTSLKIIFKKQIRYYYADGNYFVDSLIGEYQYIESGVVVANYLSRINDTSIDPASHYFYSNTFMEWYLRPRCADCDELVKRLRIRFTDPERAYFMYDAFVGLTDDFPAPKLVFKLYRNEGDVIPEGAPSNHRIPLGQYILTKL